MRRRALRPLLRLVPGFVIGLSGALLLAAASPARADSCAALCPDPAREPACSSGDAVWGFREPGGTCRGGSFGYLDSRDSADAERLRLARAQKRVCEDSGDCERFEALAEADLVCLACSEERSSSADSQPMGGRPPPCAEDEWLQVGTPREPPRCFVEFAALPPRLAMQGRCVEGDCRAGVGTVRWPSGEAYSGGFRAGRRHGQGAFRWPDGRAYIGGWRDGQPSELGTRIYANGHYKAGYFDRGRYLGPDLDHVSRSTRPGPKPAPRPPISTRSCEEACTEDAELYLGRINDEYECCFARHAFCAQRAEAALEQCTGASCAASAREQRDDCDLRYACESVQRQKIARFRRDGAACVEGCSSQELDDQGLRISERGTLLPDD